MTVWIVYFKNTEEGTYVAAPTCEAAKKAFQALYGADHTVRALHIMDVDKADFPETVVLSPHDPRLSALGLRYAQSKKGAIKDDK